MDSHFMRSYTLQTIKTCHHRNAPAIGGMAVHIPVKNNPAANEKAMEYIRADKKREANDGHDGTWVAHPGLVAVAQAEFDAVMKTPNQISRKRDDVQVTATDLLKVPTGTITEAGLRNNISVCLQYLEAWLRGSGAIPVNNLMEDAATVEVSRAQIWQWIRHPRGILQDGRKVTIELFHHIMNEGLANLQNAIGEEQFGKRRFAIAAQILDEVITDDRFVEFLTLPAYRYLK
jgi:malate synthase